MRRKYKHLYWDFDNTIYDFTANSKASIKIALHNLSIEVDDFEAYFRIYTEINDELWAQYRTHKITKHTLRTTRFEKSLKEYGADFDVEGSVIDDEFIRVMPSQTVLFEGAHEVLELFRKRGFKQHIITNGFKEVQYKKLQNCNLSEYFDSVFISEELQCNKPGRAIFEKALKDNNARKSQSIMIGDSWESDIVGARNFGIDQIFFAPNGEQAKGEVTHCVSSLRDLVQCIGYSV